MGTQEILEERKGKIGDAAKKPDAYFGEDPKDAF